MLRGPHAACAGSNFPLNRPSMVPRHPQASRTSSTLRFRDPPPACLRASSLFLRRALGLILPVERLGLKVRPQRLDGGAIAVGPVEAGAREQRGLAPVQAGMHAIAVVLDLVQPAFACWSFVHEAGELRLDPSRR